MPSFVSLLQNRAEPGRRGSISQGAQTTEDQRRFFCQEHQPTNPNHPTNPTQPPNHPPHPPLNPLFPGCGQLTPPLPHTGFKSLLVFYGESGYLFFFMEMECARVIIYISHLVGNSEVDNSEVATIKSSHLLMRWLSVCCSKSLPYGATSKRLKPGKWYSNVIANSWFGLLTHISI